MVISCKGLYPDVCLGVRLTAAESATSDDRSAEPEPEPEPEPVTVPPNSCSRIGEYSLCNVVISEQ